MIIGCWNIAWQRPNTKRGSEMIAALRSHDPELLCIAEGHVDTLGSDWHGIASDPDYGYPIKPGQRKVALWSRTPWENVDEIGTPSMPPGRFVSGKTVTSIGPIRVVGICVPWFAAHVKGGRRDAENWTEHDAFLKGLREALASIGNDIPAVLVGDFNQRIPRKGAPIASYELLMAGLGGRFDVWTAGSISGLGRQVVCHIAGTSDLECTEAIGLPRDANGTTLSDHDGLIVQIGKGPTRAIAQLFSTATSVSSALSD